MITFVRAEITEQYRKKWNERLNDFIYIYKDGVKLNDTLYRKGGMGGEFKDGYMLLLKHIEAYYEDSITKDKNRKRHLSDAWCILDTNGIEKVNFKKFESPYLSGGQIYSLDQKYYNIETGEFYCKAYTSITSSQFIFLDNQFDSDKSRRGVMKINKQDGTWELFPEKHEDIIHLF